MLKHCLLFDLTVSPPIRNLQEVATSTNVNLQGKQAEYMYTCVYTHACAGGNAGAQQSTE